MQNLVIQDLRTKLGAMKSRGGLWEEEGDGQWLQLIAAKRSPKPNGLADFWSRKDSSRMQSVGSMSSGANFSLVDGL